MTAPRSDPAPPLPPLDSMTYRRLAALQRACRSPSAVAQALDDGMDPDTHFDFHHESRPLFSAINAKPWNSETVRTLLARGADPNLPDDRGHTPIDSAFCHAHHGGEAFEMARLLASHPGLRAPPGSTLLGIAFYAPALVPMLVERGYDPNALCDEAALCLKGSTARQMARPTCLARCASFGTTTDGDAVRALIAHGANPNDDRGGVSPLAFALLGSGLLDGITALLEAGANPLWSGFGGIDCLAIAKARLVFEHGTYLVPLREATIERIESFHHSWMERRLLAQTLQAATPSSLAKGL